MAVLINNSDAHRQTAGREKIFHTDGLLDAQQRLQTVGQIHRRQRIKVAHALTRALAYPEKVIPTFFLRRVAVFHNPLM